MHLRHFAAELKELKQTCFGGRQQYRPSHHLIEILLPSKSKIGRLLHAQYFFLEN